MSLIDEIHLRRPISIIKKLNENTIMTNLILGSLDLIWMIGGGSIGRLSTRDYMSHKPII